MLDCLLCCFALPEFASVWTLIACWLVLELHSYYFVIPNSDSQESCSSEVHHRDKIVPSSRPPDLVPFNYHTGTAKAASLLFCLGYEEKLSFSTPYVLPSLSLVSCELMKSVRCSSIHSSFVSVGLRERRV